MVSGADIKSLAAVREAQMSPDRARWEMLAKLYLGKWRELFPTEFRADQIASIAPFIQRSWRMFTNLTGKVPDIHSMNLNETQKRRNQADTIEKICFGYNRNWRAHRKFRVLSHFLVGYGAVAAGVIPHFRTQQPILLVEDPRNVYPGAGWDSTNTMALGGISSASLNTTAASDFSGQLQDIIVRKSMTGRALRSFAPDSTTVQALIADTTHDWNQNHSVLMYYDSEEFVVVLESSGEVIKRSANKLGHVPWYFTTVFAGDRAAGQSPFEQQIGLNLAFMRVLDQKMALNDAVIWPYLLTKGVVTEDHFNRRLKAISADGDAKFLSPPAQFQVDRDLAMLGDLLRKFNFETEASQGDIQQAPSARGIVEMNKPTVDTVQSFFDDQADLLSFLYTDSLLIDREEFGDVEKELAGWGKGETFLESYKPNRDIGPRFGFVSVEYGPGLGGFEGHMALLQSLGADAISIDTVMEWNPHIRSVTDERRKIFLTKARDLVREQGFSGQLTVDLGWMAKLINAVENGSDPYEFIETNPPGPNALNPQMAAAAQQGGYGAPMGMDQPPPMWAQPPMNPQRQQQRQLPPAHLLSLLGAR